MIKNWKFFQSIYQLILETVNEVNEVTTFMFKIPKELIKKFFLKFLDMEKLPVKQQKT